MTKNLSKNKAIKNISINIKEEKRKVPYVKSYVSFKINIPILSHLSTQRFFHPMTIKKRNAGDSFKAI